MEGEMLKEDQRQLEEKEEKRIELRSQCSSSKVLGQPSVFGITSLCTLQ